MSNESIAHTHIDQTGLKFLEQEGTKARLQRYDNEIRYKEDAS